MKRRPLVYATILYSLGIYTAYVYPLPPIAWFGCVTGILLFWFGSGSRRRETFGWVLLAAFFCLGGAFYQLKDNRQQDLLTSLPLEQEITVVGKIISGPLEYPGRTVYLLELSNGAKIHLVIRGEDTGTYPIGEQVEVTGLLDRPKQARNPGEFNYRAYLWRQGILAELSCSPVAVAPVKPAHFHWRNTVLGAKDRFSRLVETQMSPRAGAVAKALIFGDKTALEKELKELFLTLGIMHLLAVSGLHVGFLLVLIRLLRELFPLRPGYGLLLTGVLLFFYCVLTDFTPSVLRASIMAFVFSFGNWIGKERDYYTNLAAAALILLLHNPHNLFQSGFQLSFIAAWGIVYFSTALGMILPKSFRFRELIMIPVAAQIGVLPVSAYYFNLVSIIGLPVNILLVPVAGLIVVAGLAAFMVSLVSSGLAGVLLVSVGVALDTMIWLVSPLEKFYLAAVTVATPSWLTMLAYYLGVVLARELVLKKEWRVKYKEWYKAVIAGAMVIICLVIGWYQLIPRPLEIVFLDVGQGDSVFIRTPKGATILVDGGGSPAWLNSEYRVGKEVVIPYLERRGIKELDLLISTHPDTDHLQGLEDVLSELGAQLVVIPPSSLFDDGYDTLLQLAQDKGIPVAEVVAGDKIILEEESVSLEILNPPSRNQTFFTAVDNNHSLVIRVSYGKGDFLLTGDVEIEGLRHLLEKDETGPAVIFKAPHHGSRTGYYEPYLDQLEPLGVILSVGKNSYGHPAPELLEYWEERQVTVYRTDEQGAIMIYTDGETLNIRPFL